MGEEEPAPQPTDPTADPGRPVAGMAPEVSRRISSILDAVEREASRLREEAQTEADRYTESARRHADGLVAERRRRISELSDELIVKSEAVVGRLHDAAPVREGFENLVRALADAAERLSIEAQTTRDDFAPPSYHEAARRPPQQPPGEYPQRQPAPGYYPPQPQPGPPQAAQTGFAGQPYPARAPSQPTWQPPATPSAPGPSNPANPAARSRTWQELDDARMIAIELAGAGGTRAEVRGHLNLALGIVDTEPTLDEIFGHGTGEDARVSWGTGGS